MDGFFMDKKRPIVDKMAQRYFLRYAVAIVINETRIGMEVIICVIFIFG